MNRSAWNELQNKANVANTSSKASEQAVKKTAISIEQQMNV